MAATTRGPPTTTTTTTSSTGGSPLRRSLVWSHNTSYTGAAGVHSEVSRQTQAWQLSSQKQMTSSLSTSHSIHQKELRSLKQHRKSLEMSMLAYTKRMRKISADRLGVAGLQSSPAWPEQSASSGELTTSALERLLAFSKTGRSGSKFSQSAKEKDARDSADSGIEDTEADNERKENKSSKDDRVFKVVRKLPKEPKQEARRRPASFHTLDSIVVTDKTTEASDRTELARNVGSGLSDPTRKTSQRQRRPGTAEKPDLLALKLTREAENRDRHHSSSSSDDTDAFLAITPFPECQASGCPDQNGPNGDTDDEDSYYASHASKKKLPKTRENYWSFRKAHHRRSFLLASSNKNNPEPCPSPRPVAPKRIREQKTPPPPVRKTFYTSFRYSDAVDDVLRSFDDRYSDRITHTAIRRVTDILPTLDVEELRLERKKMKESKARGLKPVKERRKLSQDTQESVESHGDADDEREGPAFVILRERSMSAPQIPFHEDEESFSGEDTVTDMESGVKPVLKKLDDSLANGASVRKTVQFDLPPCEEQVETRNE